MPRFITLISFWTEKWRRQSCASPEHRFLEVGSERFSGNRICFARSHMFGIGYEGEEIRHTNITLQFIHHCLINNLEKIASRWPNHPINLSLAESMLHSVVFHPAFFFRIVVSDQRTSPKLAWQNCLRFSAKCFVTLSPFLTLSGFPIQPVQSRRRRMKRYNNFDVSYLLMFNFDLFSYLLRESMPNL